MEDAQVFPPCLASCMTTHPLQAIVRRHNMRHYMECSPLAGINADEVFAELLLRIAKERAEDDNKRLGESSLSEEHEDKAD